MGFTKFLGRIAGNKENQYSQSNREIENKTEFEQKEFYERKRLSEEIESPLGIHVSIAGGFDRAVDNAVMLGCMAFQIFTRNPRGWTAKKISDNDVIDFKKKLALSRIDRFATFCNMPYLANLSHPEARPSSISLNSFIDDAKRCSKLGIPYFVTRLGNHMGMGEEKGIGYLVKAITKAVRETPSDVTFLLKNNAGTPNSVGSSFEKIASIFRQLKTFGRIGICLNTCHMFLAGYGLRTETTVTQTLKKFDELIGFESLKVIELADSKGDIGSRTDRHEHIGLGKIGEEGLRHVIKFANSKKIPMILETPIDNRRDSIGNMKKVIELSKT